MPSRVDQLEQFKQQFSQAQIDIFLFRNELKKKGKARYLLAQSTLDKINREKDKAFKQLGILNLYSDDEFDKSCPDFEIALERLFESVEAAKIDFNY